MIVNTVNLMPKDFYLNRIDRTLFLLRSFKTLFRCVCVCVSMYGYMHMTGGACGGQKCWIPCSWHHRWLRVCANLLQDKPFIDGRLSLREHGGCWNKPRSSGRAVSALTLWVVLHHSSFGGSPSPHKLGSMDEERRIAAAFWREVTWGAPTMRSF